MIAAGDQMKTILVADDRATSRELVRIALEHCGYEICEARDGGDALKMAREVRPDLIILDLHMPGLDGFAVISELRLDAELAATPVLALTASAMQGDKERALSVGFTSYLAKPIGLSKLREEVARLLR